MSVARPENLKEWREYISTLSRDEITSKCIACNTMRFVRLMTSEEEGMSMEDVEGIFLAFAKRFDDVALRPPGKGVFDIAELMDSPEAEKLELPKDVEYEPEPDEIDEFVDSTDLEEEWGEVSEDIPDA